MPTPIGHALGGVISASLFNKEKTKNWIIFVTVLVLAELPDIDFLFGLIEGRPNKYHHHFTHSFLFVILAAFLAAVIINKIGIIQFSKSFVLFTVAGVSHIIFDVLALDTSEPFGAPIFWPLWNGYVISPVTIFSDVQRSSSASAFVPSLFSLHNLKTIFVEIVVLAPIWLIIGLRRYFKEKKA
jgi:membrane-bound metal-dependent hydrolase YbcI (DUF457 family)